MAKKIRNFAAILAVSAVVGTILLVLVFLLPVGPMRKNVEKSVGDMLKTGDEIPEDAFSQYLWKNRETYTDAIMVQNAIERLPDKNAYEHAMWMYHYDLEEDVWTPEDSLKSFCESHENVNNMYLHIYARYWHGYLLYLKPLLLLFSWQHVVWLELAVQIALMIWVLVTAIQKQNAGVAVVTLGSFLFMKPVLVLVSLTMSVCWILTLLAVEYMLLHHDRLHEKGQYPEFFLIVGILTSYFDFLTYPIVTLGIPLCCYFLLESDRLWNNIKRLTGFSVSWAIGYAGMWAAIAIGMLVMIIVTGKWKEIFAQLVPVVLTAAIPFVWIIAVQHHSALHARFTFRILSVAAAAAITFIVLNVKQAKKQQKSQKIFKKAQ